MRLKFDWTISAAVTGVLLSSLAVADDSGQVPSVFRGSAGGAGEVSSVNGAPYGGGKATLRLEQGRAGIERQTSCDVGGLVLGLLTLGATGGGSGCRDYDAAVFHDLNLDLSAGWDKRFIGNLHGSAAFYGFDTASNPHRTFPIIELGLTAFEMDRMHSIYGAPEAGIRFGADTPGHRRHLSLLGSVGGYGDNVHGHDGFFLGSAIARGEVNITDRVSLRGQLQAGVLAAGKGDPSTETTTTMSGGGSGTGSQTTTTTTTNLLSPGYEQRGAGGYEAAQCTLQVDLTKNFYVEANLMAAWQQIQTADIGLNGARGAVHNDSSSELSTGVGVGGHF